MPNVHYISAELLDLATIKSIIEEHKVLELSKEVVLNIEKSKKYLEKKILNNSQPIYGINTGFGSLYNVKIASDEIAKLQENIVMSHACGTGNLVPKEIVKLMLLLKVQSLSYGYSGVQLKTVQRLIDFYNLDIVPLIYELGSLGASGDLAPLAHMALPLIGKGEVYYQNEICPSKEILKKLDFETINLEAKEGLALLNGTQFMSAYGIYSLLKSHKLSYLSDLISCVSIDAFNCNMSPFDPLVHLVRPHRGQVITAERVLD